MGEYWSIEREVGNVAILILDRKDREVNTLSAKVLRDLNDILDELAGDNTLEGIVFISGKKDFVVGADITEIAAMKTAEEATSGSRQMQAILNKISEFKVPTTAAIHGQALGGGLELALACTWRICSTDARTKLALPEIQLGLIPGAGGTQRLPRLIGIQAALDMILTGKRISAKKAEKLGLVDSAVPVQLLREQAIRFAQQKRPSTRKLPTLIASKITADLPKWATEGNPIGRKLIAKKAKEMVEEKTKGFYPASFKALDAVFEGYETSLSKGLEIEANLFGQLAVTRESNSLVHLFHATTGLKKHRYREAGKARFGSEKIKKTGIIGAGFMGAGIATVCAEKGIRVLYSDPNKESLGRALKHTHDYFAKKVERKALKAFEAAQKISQVSPGLSTTGFDQCDIVIEAVFEDLKLKQKILDQLEANTRENFIFATNTSAIPIHKIAELAKNPERVIGMHFFSPVEKMPLLEVVVSDKTADWVTARTVEMGQDLGKQVIVVKDGPGFYTTRALSFYLNEAATMLAEGISIHQIDKALMDFGFPVGPITLIDEVGIDVGMHVLETMQKSFPDRMTTPSGLQAVADSGRLGRKNNKGFYLYESGRKGRPDQAIYDLVGVTQLSSDAITPEEIVDRCVLQFVNETVLCLEEGILNSPSDGDVGAVFGLGFPPFWGGPFKYIDHIGASTVVERLNGLVDKYGSRFQPAKLLIDYANRNQRFFSAEA